MRSKPLQLKPISKQVIRGAMMFIEIKEMIKRNSENSFLFCGSFAIKSNLSTIDFFENDIFSNICCKKNSWLSEFFHKNIFSSMDRCSLLSSFS